ncbi:MAG: hypothetical protein H6898_14620 [Rhodobacter sp.]|nr:hypothetical protein [Paracoccaceae bacterium]MCC0077791.1 hypothetical protein [Rhodobacter sp.]
MRASIVVAAAAGIILITGSAQAWERLHTEAEYRARVVGHRTSVGDRGHVTVHPDGTVTGVWGGQPVVGAWTWDGGYYCRNLRIGSTETGTNCQRIEVQGNQIRSTNDRGNGSSMVGQLD